MSTMLRARSATIQCARVSLGAAQHQRNTGQSHYSVSIVRKFSDNAGPVAAPLLRVEQAAPVTASGGRSTAVEDEAIRTSQMESAPEDDKEAKLLDRMREHTRVKGIIADRKVLALLEEGRKRGIRSLEAYNLTIEAMTTHALDAMPAMWSKMKADGLKPNTTTYNILIAGHARDGQLEMVASVREDMREAGLAPDAMTYSNLMVAFSRQQPMGVYRNWEKLKENGWSPSLEAYDALLDAMTTDRKYKDVLAVLKIIREEGKRPTIDGFSCGLTAAVALQLPTVAEELFVTMAETCTPRHDAYKSMMLVYSGANQYPEASAYWRLLLTQDGIDDVVVKLDVYHLAVSIAVLGEQWEEFDAILDVMEERKMLSNESLFDAVLKMKLGHGNRSTEQATRLDEAWRRLCARGLEPCLWQVPAMAAFMYSARRYESAVAMYKHTHEAGSRLTMYRFEEWVVALACSNQLDAAMKVLELAKKETKQTGSIITYAKMIQQCNTNQWETALKILQMAKDVGKAGNMVYTSTITKLSNAGKLQAARDLLQEMWMYNDRRMRPTDDQYNALLEECKRLDEKEMALTLLADMGSTSPARRPSRANIHFLVKCLSGADRHDEVLAFCQNLRRAGITIPDEVYALAAESCFVSQDKMNCCYYVAKAKELNVKLPPDVERYGKGDRFTTLSLARPRKDRNPMAETRAHVTSKKDAAAAAAAAPAEHGDGAPSFPGGETAPSFPDDGRPPVSSDAMPDQEAGGVSSTSGEANASLSSPDEKPATSLDTSQGDSAPRAGANKRDGLQSSPGGQDISETPAEEPTVASSERAGSADVSAGVADKTKDRTYDQKAKKPDQESDTKPRDREVVETSTLGKIGSFFGRLFGK